MASLHIALVSVALAVISANLGLIALATPQPDYANKLAGLSDPISHPHTLASSQIKHFQGQQQQQRRPLLTTVIQKTLDSLREFQGDKRLRISAIIIVEDVEGVKEESLSLGRQKTPEFDAPPVLRERPKVLPPWIPMKLNSNMREDNSGEDENNSQSYSHSSQLVHL